MHELAAVEAGAVEPSAAQRAAAVYRHPLRADIEALLHKRTPGWVALWLEERYPLEDDEGERHPNARAHAKLRLSARAIERYRQRFMPEAVPGVDLLPAELEELVGRHAPRPDTSRHELQLLEQLQHVSLSNLARSMAADEDLEMLTPITLEAQKQAFTIADGSIKAKSKLGVPGYEQVAQKMEIDQRIDQTSRNVNFELHGRTDPRTGAPIPVESEKVDAIRALLERGPDAARTIVAAAREQTVDADATEE